MATTLPLKRKNIDLPADAWQKLSYIALSQGKSLKAYVESLLLKKAEAVTVTVSVNPSPSGDEWFDDPANINMVKLGMSQADQGKTHELTIEQIKEILAE